MLKWTAVPLLLLSATFCQAVDISDQRTNGLLNGRFWNGIDDSGKLFFLIGYCEAAVDALRCPAQTEFGETIKGIDKFYQEPENLRLTFISAMRIFTRKVEGAKPTEIEALMDLARKYADARLPK
jgi:hypothetical protein